MKELVIKREFNAPKETVFKAWSDPEMLRKWWAPEGMENGHISVDFKVGGLFRYAFTAQDGTSYWGRGIYKNIDEPDYLSYEDCFTDEDGNDVPPSHFGMDSDELEVSMVEVRFEEKDGRTTMTVTMEAGSNAEDVGKGWHSMFDKLQAVTEAS